jgi:hypothetical protein
MKYVLTAREINEGGYWDEFCNLRGFNPWGMNEGLIDPDEEFTFTQEEAERLGIVPRKD